MIRRLIARLLWPAKEAPELTLDPDAEFQVYITRLREQQSVISDTTTALLCDVENGFGRRP